MDAATWETMIALAKPVFDSCVKAIRNASSEFDSWMPGPERVTVEGARPKFMFCRIMHHLEAEYGRTGDVCIVDLHDLQFLRIANESIGMGVRLKKLNRQFRSCNHQSDNQDELRRTGLFPGHEYHLFLGYRMTKGLVPTVSHIALTFEDQRGVRWRHLIWSAEDGMNPAETSLPFELPPSPADTAPAPKVRPKRKPAKRSRRSDKGQTGTAG